MPSYLAPILPSGTAGAWGEGTERWSVAAQGRPAVGQRLDNLAGLHISTWHSAQQDDWPQEVLTAHATMPAIGCVRWPVGAPRWGCNYLLPWLHPAWGATQVDQLTCGPACPGGDAVHPPAARVAHFNLDLAAVGDGAVGQAACRIREGAIRGGRRVGLVEKVVGTKSMRDGIGQAVASLQASLGLP